MSHQETVTSQLSSHIRTIQHERATGVLIVKRGTGAALEEGQIAFINGRITEAKVGQHVGAEALNWLSTWRNCLVSFLSDDRKQSPVFPSPQRNAPQRIVPPEIALHTIERKGLTRAHRHLFLLIDGQRLREDFPRLTGRDQQEVDHLLYDLAQAMLIWLPHPK